MTRVLVLVALLVGCGSDTDCAKDAAAPQGGVPVGILTRDDVCLVADHYIAPEGQPGVVLLHMTPLSWDRKSWSLDLIRDLHAERWHVLNLDRRGAGDSEGSARDAFEGESGRFDVEAAVGFLQDQGVGPLTIVSASNGTTTALDYTVWASQQGLLEPSSIVMMSPGDYTENQTQMAELADLGTPLLLQHDDTEVSWPTATQDAHDPGTWQRVEYPGAGHGSQMLDHTPDVEADILDFLDDSWPTLP